MGAEIIALVSSALWASDTILVRRGARYAGVAVAALISFFLSMVVLWAIIWLFFDFSFLQSDAILYFAVSGLIQPAIVRFLHYTGIVHLGASRAGPVRSMQSDGTNKREHEKTCSNSKIKTGKVRFG